MFYRDDLIFRDDLPKVMARFFDRVTAFLVCCFFLWHIVSISGALEPMGSFQERAPKMEMSKEKD